MHSKDSIKGRGVRGLQGAIAAMLLASTAAVADSGAASGARMVESFVAVPMPPGFQVIVSELEGPVFADSRGRTLYVWPFKRLRNGYAGEQKGKPACYDEVSRVTAGLMSPYPAGILLPELDKRPSCTDLWPPVLAAADAQPIGSWTILERKDGTRQWAYEEQPLYTSVLDRQPGDVLGGTTRRAGGDSPAVRVPLPAARQNERNPQDRLGPPPLVPPGFAIKTTTNGRLLTTDKNFSVYSYEKDTAERSMCTGECALTWQPLTAPLTARAQGEWGVIERSPGVKQWTFRGKPLYASTAEIEAGEQWSLEGSDAPGWYNVYTQLAPSLPPEFTVQDTLVGQVLADSRGRTIYTYICGDDSIDQLSCDHPSDTQVYRLAICGKGDQEKCLKTWPYVLAEKDAKGQNRAWTVIQIDPKTGRKAEPGQAGALSVWAYRDRPVYTYYLDEKPGDVHGAGTGEWRGQRNGLKAFWVRDDHFGGTL